MLLLSTCLRQLVLLAVLLLTTLPRLAAQTQPDSTATLRYEEETVVAPAPPVPATTSQVQEQRLFKLGLNNLYFLPANVSREVSNVPQAARYGRYGLHLAYEQKLGAAWTVLVEASPYILRYEPATGPATGPLLCARAQLAGRYYYNLGRRLRLGKSAGNFSGNYVALALGAGFGTQAHETAFFFFEQSGPAARFDAALLYGLQRRLGRAGFVDFSAGLPLALSAGAATRTYYLGAHGPTLALNLRIGLCLGR